jgi:Pyruvate/2-oxoacid:ferredoxin oxidoreductase gamma subunit
MEGASGRPSSLPWTAVQSAALSAYKERSKTRNAALSSEVALSKDVLVVMSQEAYTRFAPELREGGLLIVEEELQSLAK